MNKKRIVVGSHAFFYPAGAVYTVPAVAAPGNIVSRTAKPAGNDPAWFDFGTSKWKRTNTSKVEEFIGPAPGMRQLQGHITTFKGEKWTGTIMEMTNLIWGLLMQASGIPLTGAGGQYNPLEGDVVMEGWLQLHHYNQFNELIDVGDRFVGLQIPGDVEFGDTPLDVSVEASTYFSTLNTGTIS